jgi:hypothetical protein
LTLDGDAPLHVAGPATPGAVARALARRAHRQLTTTHRTAPTP